MPPTQRRPRPVEDDGSDEDAPPRQRQNRQDTDDDSGDDSANGIDGDGHQTADDQLAKKLIRYAMACDYSRTAIRRDGIKERVLGNQGRSFKRIFALAQTQLRAVWGMEMRELEIREKTTLHEKRQAMKSGTQPRTGSGSYTLESTLPEPYRSAIILLPSRTPSAEDEATYVAFYTILVTLIRLSGGELSEQKLRRHLQRLNAEQNVSTEKTEVTLKKLERQGYLIKKVDRPAVGHEGDHTITWHVGPRAKEEIGLDGVMGMVREVYGEWDEEHEKKLRAGLGIKDGPLANVAEEDEHDENDQTAGNGEVDGDAGSAT